MERTIADAAPSIDRLEHAVARAEAALAVRDAERLRLLGVREAAEAARSEMAAMLLAVEG